MRNHRASCPICRDTAPFYRRRGPASYFLCPNCGTIFQCPFPDADAMAQYAEQEYREGVYQFYMQARRIKHATFRGRISEISRRAAGQRLLDVGCSCGFLIEVALDAGFDAYGVEWSAAAVAAASDVVRPRIKLGDVSQQTASPIGLFDVVTAFDVLEHMHDPLGFLTDTASSLRPGGLLTVSTPDTGHFLRPLLGARWPHLQPYQHTILFSERSMRLALRQTGYVDVEIVPATKVLTLDYLAEQLGEHSSAITGAYQMLAGWLPEGVRRRPARVNIGEMLVFARTPGEPTVRPRAR